MAWDLYFRFQAIYFGKNTIKSNEFCRVSDQLNYVCIYQIIVLGVSLILVNYNLPKSNAIQCDNNKNQWK